MDINDICDKDGFLAYLGQMRDELRHGGADWQNTELEPFLEAIQAWAGSSTGKLPDNPWRAAAVILTIGKIYE